MTRTGSRRPNDRSSDEVGSSRPAQREQHNFAAQHQRVEGSSSKVVILLIATNPQHPTASTDRLLVRSAELLSGGWPSQPTTWRPTWGLARRRLRLGQRLRLRSSSASSVARPERRPDVTSSRWARPSSRSNAVCTSSGRAGGRGERHLRLDADDDGLGASRSRRVRKIVERFRGERAEDIERGDVDHDSSRPVDADLIDEIGLELHQLLVVERGVDGGDQTPRSPRTSPHGGVEVEVRSGLAWLPGWHGR